MNYYVKNSATEPVQGPFSVDELNHRIANRTLSPKARATSDIGESRERVAKSPAWDWMPLAKVPGLVGVEKLGSVGDEPESSRIPSSLHAGTSLIVGFHTCFLPVHLVLTAFAFMVAGLSGSMLGLMIFVGGFHAMAIVFATRLRSGMRSGVYGLSVLAVLTLVALIRSPVTQITLIAWIALAVLYVPTLVMAVRNWSALE